MSVTQREFAQGRLGERQVDLAGQANRREVGIKRYGEWHWGRRAVTGLPITMPRFPVPQKIKIANSLTGPARNVV